MTIQCFRSAPILEIQLLRIYSFILKLGKRVGHTFWGTTLDHDSNQNQT